MASFAQMIPRRLARVIAPTALTNGNRASWPQSELAGTAAEQPEIGVYTHPSVASQLATLQAEPGAYSPSSGVQKEGVKMFDFPGRAAALGPCRRNVAAPVGRQRLEGSGMPARFSGRSPSGLRSATHWPARWGAGRPSRETRGASFFAEVAAVARRCRPSRRPGSRDRISRRACGSPRYGWVTKRSTAEVPLTLMVFVVPTMLLVR